MKYYICYDSLDKHFLDLTEEQERLLLWLSDNDYFDNSCTDIIKIDDKCKKV